MKLTRLMTSGIFLFCFLAKPVFAEVDIMKEMVTTSDHVQGLEAVLMNAKQDAGVSVEFPGFIPKTDKKYFASSDATSKQNGFSYMINIDSTADCNGAKYCNVGRVSAQAKDKPEMMRDKNKKVITVSVDLADGTKAFYTPGHAMGDYFPANIQWIDNKVLYMIIWNIDPSAAKLSRDLLITMANSAKHPGSG